MQVYNNMEIKSTINTIINGNDKNLKWKIISYINDDEQQLYLIELLEDYQRFIIDIKNNKIYETKTKDIGTVCFDGTNHTLEKEIITIIPIIKQYTGFDLRDRICEILNCPYDGWSIVDELENLYLIHYNDDADMNLVGHLRGVLIDINAGIKIAESSGYTPNVKVKQLIADNNGDVNIYDENNQLHSFPSHSTAIKPIYEGTVVRIILYNGNVYKLTHRKIRTMKSHWGKSEYFPVLYNKGSGPKDIELFDMSKNYSPWCYVFMVVDPKLLIASKQMVNSPYVVFLSHHQMYTTDEFCPYPIEQTETIMNAKFVVSVDKTKIIDSPCIIVPPIFTLQQANYHLAYGYYSERKTNDLRTLYGEAVMLFNYDQSNNVTDVVKVNGLSYDYRVTLRGNDPNAYHQFFNLVHYSYKSLEYYPDWVHFNQKFVIYENYTKDNLQLLAQDNVIAGLRTTMITEEQKKDKDFLLKMIWLNYVVSLPISLQMEALEYYDQFIADRIKVIHWLQSNLDYDVNTKLSTRAKNIINQAKKTVMKNLTANDIIYKIIHNESGISLYSLIKNMKVKI